jgi:mycothiol synthase
VDFRGAYHVRPARWEDLAAAADVLAADDLDDAGQVVLDAGFLRGQWAQPGFDLTTDAWVAVAAAGMVVGCGQTTRDAPDVAGSWGVVHPDHRGRGVGSALLARIESRALELVAGAPHARFRHSVNASDEAAAALLRSRGLALARHFWHMGVELPAGVDPSPPPAGVTITSLQPSTDLREVHHVLDEAFAEHWDFRSLAFDDWARDHTLGPDHDPGLWRLAWEDERLAGALVAVVREGRGWVTLLGVRAESRGRGVASALLRHAFAGFAGRGVRSVVLAVDAANTTGATILYESVGMHVVKRFDIWERSVDDTPLSQLSQL